jgi:hypothetical protein
MNMALILNIIHRHEFFSKTVFQELKSVFIVRYFFFSSDRSVNSVVHGLRPVLSF